MLNAKYCFHGRKIILKVSLKLEAGTISHAKSNNSLTNAVVKHKAVHMLDIFLKIRGVT
jgi:hypothetical protein